MSKEFKRCPRCNFKTHIDFARCGNCGLNFSKFEQSTNLEAKSAFRMGEKERVLYSKQVPSDVSKCKTFFKCLFAGWFGLHYFALGRTWHGLFQILGTVLLFVYSYLTLKLNLYSGYLGLAALMLGFTWLASFVIWIKDIFEILFNRFKYPVSLPYSKTEKGE